MTSTLTPHETVDAPDAREALGEQIFAGTSRTMPTAEAESRVGELAGEARFSTWAFSGRSMVERYSGRVIPHRLRSEKRRCAGLMPFAILVGMMLERNTPMRSVALIPFSVSRNLPFVTTYAVDAWAALSDPTRREIFSRLAVRPRSVTDLASELPVSRPAVSQHLRVLKDADLVWVRPEGTDASTPWIPMVWGRCAASSRGSGARR